MVRETLQLDAAGACLFSNLLKAEPDGYSDGLCRACAPHAPAHRTSLGTPYSASSPSQSLYMDMGMVIMPKMGVQRDGAMGGSMSLFLSPKGRTRRLQRRALSPLYSLCSRCIQLQRLAHHPHRILVQPVQVGLLMQEPRR